MNRFRFLSAMFLAAAICMFVAGFASFAGNAAAQSRTQVSEDEESNNVETTAKSKPAEKTQEEAEEEAEPLAVINQYKGNVMVLRGATGEWEAPDGEGFPVREGDVVRTGQGGMAMVTFGEDGYLAMLPLSDLMVDATETPEGGQAAVAVMEEGRAWIRINVAKGNNQLIVVTKNSIVNGSKASVFVESQKKSCVDVFQGDVAMRPRGDHTKVVGVNANERAVMKTDQGDIQTGSIQEGFNEADSDYSCMTADSEGQSTGQSTAQAAGQPAEQANEQSAGAYTRTGQDIPEPQVTVELEEEGDSYIVVLTASAVVIFSEPPKEEEPEENPYAAPEVDIFAGGGAEEPEAAAAEEAEPPQEEPEPEMKVELEEEEESYVVVLTGTTTLVVQGKEEEKKEEEKAEERADASEQEQQPEPEEEEAYEEEYEEPEEQDFFDSGSDSYAEEAAMEQEAMGYEEDYEDEEYEDDGDDAFEEEPAEIEYEEIEVVYNTEIVFIASEEGETPEKCEIPPRIQKVFVSRAEVFEDDFLPLKSETNCGPEAKLKISWQVKPICGAVTLMEFYHDVEKKKYPPGGIGVTVAGKFELSVDDNEEREFRIVAKDSEGHKSEFYFIVAVADPEKQYLPILKNITVDGEDIKRGVTYELDNDFCEPYILDIEGIAESKCGEILQVKVKAHETDLIVDGTDEWSTYLNLKQPQITPFIIEARDEKGLRSVPFVFTLDYDKTVTEPYVAVETVGGFETEGGFGEILELYKNDLVGGRLMVTGAAESDSCTIKRTEVSVNGGGSWAKAAGSSGWTYSFTPREGPYEITARAFDVDENESEEMMTPVEVFYWNKTIEEVIQAAFEDICRAYQDRDADTIIESVSNSYSSGIDSIESRSNMESALTGKFTEISQVYLRYRVQTVVASGRTSGRVIFSWDANPNTSGYSKTGTFIFQREGSWKLIAIEDDKSFLRYTDIADSIQISAGKTTLTADNFDSTEISAVVRDSAYNACKNGTTVTFSTSNGSIDIIGTTDDSAAIVTYTTSDVIEDATITAVSGTVSSNTVLHLIREYAPPPPPD